MQDIKQEITEEMYNRIKDKQYQEQMAEVFPNGVPVSWSMGYGYYGFRLAKEGEQHYVIHSIGSSCD